MTPSPHKQCQDELLRPASLIHADHAAPLFFMLRSCSASTASCTRAWGFCGLHHAHSQALMHMHIVRLSCIFSTYCQDQV